MARIGLRCADFLWKKDLGRGQVLDRKTCSLEERPAQIGSPFFVLFSPFFLSLLILLLSTHRQ